MLKNGEKKGLKWLLVIVLVIALTIATSLVLRENITLSEKQRKLFTQAIRLSDISLRELAEIDFAVKNLMEHDDTSLLRERLHEYIIHAMILSKTSYMLYVITDDTKYRELHTAARNLESFFISVTNKQDVAGMLEEKLPTLQEISSLLRGKLRITDFTKEDAQRFRELSEEVFG